jgi:hypothetical protein
LIGDNFGEVTVTPNFYNDFNEQIKKFSERSYVKESVNTQNRTLLKINNKDGISYLLAKNEEIKLGRKDTRQAQMMKYILSETGSATIDTEMLLLQIGIKKDRQNTSLNNQTQKRAEIKKIIINSIKDLNKVLKVLNIHLDCNFDHKNGKNTVQITMI